jgi:hypothetical protein
VAPVITVENNPSIWQQERQITFSLAYSILVVEVLLDSSGF